MSPKVKELNDDLPVNEESPLMMEEQYSSFPTSPKEKETFRIQTEVLEQLKTAFPTLQSMVLTKIPWLISLRFVGGIGSNELAAAALATTLCNVTGLSFSVGLSSALSTLSGQAKGELLSRSNTQKQKYDEE